jgi:hypothetical protein
MNLWNIAFYMMIIIFICYIFLSSDRLIEHFNPYFDYSRAYPGTFAFQPGFGYYRYNPGYRDYWYISAHDHMDNWMNGIPREVALNTNCVVPSSISEYCVNKHLNQGDNFNNSVNSCVVPSKISGSC